jgi:hypothetical protein
MRSFLTSWFWWGNHAEWGAATSGRVRLRPHRHVSGVSRATHDLVALDDQNGRIRTFQTKGLEQR